VAYARDAFERVELSGRVNGMRFDRLSSSVRQKRAARLTHHHPATSDTAARRRFSRLMSSRSSNVIAWRLTRDVPCHSAAFWGRSRVIRGRAQRPSSPTTTSAAC